MQTGKAQSQHYKQKSVSSELLFFYKKCKKKQNIENITLIV